jgi:tripartite-type tricarboxylate transporter receptor subunit TctC
MELFRLTSGITYTHVPYKGSANTVPDVVGGQVDMTTSSIIALLPHVKAGRIRALGVTSLQRSPAAPDLPTFSESGYPGFSSETWAALLGPAGMPGPVVKLLNATITQIVKTPEVAARIAAQGAAPRVGAPGEARAFIKAELVKWEKVIAAAGIKAE